MEQIEAKPCPRSNVMWVEQAHYGARFNYNGSGKRYLVTVGLQPCVALVLYHPNSKSGIMAHFDSDATVVDSMDAGKIAAKMHRVMPAGDLVVTGIFGCARDKTSDAIINSIKGYAFGVAPVIKTLNAKDCLTVDLEDGSMSCFSQVNFAAQPDSIAEDWAKAIKAKPSDYHYAAATE